MNLSLLSNFSDFLRLKEWFESFKKVTKKTPTNKDFKKGEYEKFGKFNALQIISMLWIFLGLITTNWKLFALIVSVHFITEFIVKLIGEFKIISKFISFIKLLTLNTMIFIIVMNHFHWQVDLYKLFTLYINR